MTFISEWNAETKKFTDDVGKALEQSTLYGWNLITTANPVKTGRARASWLVTVDSESNSTKKAVKGENRVYSDPEQPKIKYDFLKNRSLFITNNVEYIEYLEYGTDRFSPFAMVTRSAPKIENDIKKRFSKINSKDYSG